jgi:GNAT superfamily N-acetyltransferase
LPPIEIRPLRSSERRFAAGITARAMRDNPTTEAMFGAEPLERLVNMHDLWTAFFHQPVGPQLAALYKGCLIGVAAATPPGTCIGATFGNGAGAIADGPEPPLGDPTRAEYVRATYAVHDLPEPHWHVGPVGVEPRLQGRGIGEALMRALIDIMDEEGSASWGETDTEANVRFYTALGWTLVKTVKVVGIPLWFLRRSGGGD